MKTSMIAARANAKVWGTVLGVVLISVGLASAAVAKDPASYAAKVQTSCQEDYLSFCSAHSPGSTGMRRCMEANGKQLSKKCVNALVDAGEIPRNLRR